MYNAACLWVGVFAVGEELVRCGGKVVGPLSDILTLTLNRWKDTGSGWA